MILSLLALTAAVIGQPHNDASTQRCLVKKERCDATAPCKAAAFSRTCLDSSVPFRTAYAQVHCCLRCCLKHWLRVYKLDDNWKAFVQNGARQGAKELTYTRA